MTYNQNTQEAMENTYHVHKSTAWTIPEIDDLLTGFESWETTSMAPQRSDEVSLVRLTGTDLTSLTAGRVDRKLASPIPGTRTGKALPANATWALKADIGERGKGRNGRTFFIGLDSAQVDNNALVPTYADANLAAQNALLTAVETAVPGAVLGVLHTRANGAPLEPATFSSIVNYVYTDLVLDSQRDRLPFHKAHRRSAPPSP